MDYIPLFLLFLLLMVPLSPLHSRFTSFHLYPHSCFFTTLLNLPLSIPVLLSYFFQSFILVFPVPRVYSLHISSEYSHRLLSWCNSLADIASCTYQSLFPPHTYIVYSKLLRCWHEVEKYFQLMRMVSDLLNCTRPWSKCPECGAEALEKDDGISRFSMSPRNVSWPS